MSSYCVHFFPKKYQLNVKETLFFFFFPSSNFSFTCHVWSKTEQCDGSPIWEGIH